MNLIDQFQKFSGCEVAFTKTFGGSLVPDEKDPIIAEINTLATANGLTMNFTYPGVFTDATMRPQRLSVSIQQNDEGKWLVGNNFSIG